MDFKKTISIFGMAVPIWMLATAAVATVASATLLTVYGQIVSTQTVQQSVRLDGMTCTDQYGTGCTVSDSSTVVAGATVTDAPHEVTNYAPVSANVQIDTLSSCTPDVAPVITTTRTETYSADDYSLDANNLISVGFSGTLSQLLSMPLDYTADVTMGPTYTPNINIYLANGDVIQAWGSDWTGTGFHTVSFSNDGTIMGYGATVNTAPGAWPAIVGAHSDGSGYYLAASDLLADYGTVNVVRVEVRAQAGAAGGQTIRVIQLEIGGDTANLPDMDNINGAFMTMLPQESFHFGVVTAFPVNLLASTCTQTTQVVPGVAD